MTGLHKMDLLEAPIIYETSKVLHPGLHSSRPPRGLLSSGDLRPELFGEAFGAPLRTLRHRR